MSARTLVIVALVLVRGAQGLLERQLGVPVGLFADAATLVLLALALLRPAARPGPAGRWAVAMVVVAALWTLPSLLINTTYAATGLRAFVLPVLTGLLVALVLSEEKQRRSVRAALVLAVLLNMALALRQVAVGYTPAEMLALTTNDSTYLVGNQARTLGAMVSNQDFGLIIGLAVVVLLAVAGTTRSRRCRWAATLVSAGAAVLLVTSLLRGALLAAGLAVAMLCLCRPSIVRRVAGPVATVLVAGTAVFAVAGLAPSAPLQERFVAAVQRVTSLSRLGTDRSFRMRAEDTFPDALGAFLGHPLGVGTGAAGTPSQVYPHLAPLGAQVPDNGYLYVGIQVGVVGLVVLGGLLVSLLRHGGFTGAATDDSSRWVTRAAVVYLGGLMLTGTYWTLTGPCTLLFIIIGLAAPSPPRQPESGPLPTESFNLARSEMVPA